MRIPSSPPQRPVEPTRPAAVPAPIRSVLTKAEQAWFAEPESTGPVCYGQGGTLTETPAPSLGRTLDLRA